MRISDCSSDVCSSDLPHGKGVIPPKTRLRSYPVADRNGALWVWTGDPERADPESIVDFDFVADRENWSAFTGYLNIKANYQLVVDNLQIGRASGRERVGQSV